MDFSNINKKRAECQKLVSFGIAGIIIGILIVVANFGIEILGIIIAIAGFITMFVGFGKFSTLSKEFKNIFLKSMVEKIFQNGKYYPNKGIDVNRAYQTHLVKKADRHHTEDLITGEVDGVDFESCDLKLEERHVRRTKNGTYVYYVTYFLGRFFEFEFPKEFKSQVLVTEGMILTFFSKFKKVELESIDFNKKFKTYSTNEHDAFYILTPHFMESLMRLERNNPGTIMMSFMNRKLNLLINNNRNTFELNLFRPIDESTIKQLENDLLVIKDIITELKLNKNIFVD